MARLINIDSSITNADWLRGLEWDLYIILPGGGMKLVDKVDELLVVLDVKEKVFNEQKKAIDNFIKLLAYEAAPKSLKKEIIDRFS